jgi:hypothetical protein
VSTEYNRDRDIRFNKKCAEVLQQQQVDPAEGSWNNDTYPKYIPKKKTYGRQSTGEGVEGQQQQQSQEESWDKDD